MGIFTRDRDDDDDDPDQEDEPDCWTIRHSSEKSGFGWAEVEGWEELDEPISKTRFELNISEEQLEPGRYRLFRKEGTQLAPAEDENEWFWDYEPQDQQTREESELERRMARIESAVQDDGGGQDRPMPDDPEDAIKWMTLQSDDFMRDFGSDIAMSAWGLGGGDSEGVGYSDFEDNPLGALLYDAYNNPQKVRQSGENVGAALGAALRGAEEGFAEPEEVLGGGDQADDQDDERREQQRRREAEGGVGVTLEDLGQEGIDPETAREVAESGGESGDVDDVDEEPKEYGEPDDPDAEPFEAAPEDVDDVDDVEQRAQEEFEEAKAGLDDDELDAVVEDL